MRAQFILISLSLTYCNAYKILVVYPMPSKSHSILGDGIVRALANANHQVTYITPFPKSKPSQNIRQLNISSVTSAFPVLDDLSNIGAIMNNEKIVQNLTFFVNSMADGISMALKDPQVFKLLNDPKEQFDLLIVEWMFFELLAGLASVFNSPYIWVSSADPHSKILQLIDDAGNPSYLPGVISSRYPPLTFVERVKELAILVGGSLLDYFKFQPIQANIYKELLVPIIEKRGHKAPAFKDVIYNASLVLSNSHPSVGKPVRLPPNFIPIGGYHISRKVKKLPDHLKQLLDNSKNGLIYFSMGSNLKSKFMPEELKQDLLKMFSTLKQNVLWKFEENLPGTPSNVHIVQWAPQQSILAHANCVLFVTHGGLLSLTETIHFGKPIVTIPVFSDQFNNANMAVRKGFAKKVDLSYTMADELKMAIKDLLKDPKYAAKVKELSIIYHDRPLSPDTELVYWVEHVIKTGGAPHLRSPALDLMWYQKLYLDLIAVLFLLLIVFVYVFKKIIGLFKNNTLGKVNFKICKKE